MRQQQRGFTIIEIILVVGVVSILAVSGIAKFLDLRRQSLQASEDGTAAAVRSGIKQYAAQSQVRNRTPRYPAALDGAQAGNAGTLNQLFTNVLEHGMTDSWTKNGTLRYTGPAGGVYDYDAALGTFSRTGTNLLFSSFGNLSGWTTSGSNVKIQSGQLVMGTGENRAFTGDSSWTNYKVDVDANLTAGGGYGIFFRTTSTSPLNGYSFQYDPGYGSGEFIMRKWVNGAEQGPFARATPPTGFEWRGSTKHVMVDVSGNTFRAYVDGQLVLTGTNTAYTSGSVGLRTWGTSNAVFDNYQVSQQ